MGNNICFVDEIEELFERLNQPFVKDEWRLFIDGSKTSVQFVLLHNGNKKPSIPIAYGVGIKEEDPSWIFFVTLDTTSK